MLQLVLARYGQDSHLKLDRRGSLHIVRLINSVVGVSILLKHSTSG